MKTEKFNNHDQPSTNPEERVSSSTALERIKKEMTPVVIEHTRRHLKRMAGGADQQVVEDVLNSAVINALTHAHSFQTGTSFQSWFITIARNCYFDFYRKKKRDLKIYLPEDRVPSFENLGSNPSRDLERLVEDSIGAEQMRHVIEQLPLEYRTTLQVLLRGCSYQEIADELKIPIGTVMSRLNRAKIKIRDLLKKTPSSPVR